MWFSLFKTSGMCRCFTGWAVPNCSITFQKTWTCDNLISQNVLFLFSKHQPSLLRLQITIQRILKMIMKDMKTVIIHLTELTQRTTLCLGQELNWESPQYKRQQSDGQFIQQRTTGTTKRYSKDSLYLCVTAGSSLFDRCQLQSSFQVWHCTRLDLLLLVNNKTNPRSRT